MTLTPTKSHDQFMPVLSLIPESLHLYGHGEIEAVFTDNVRADKNELERIFPSLRKDVVSVPDIAAYPELVIPQTLRENIQILHSRFQINTHLNTLMEGLRSADELHFAFDMEWSVNTLTGHQRPVAIIQLADQDTILILQVSSITVAGAHFLILYFSSENLSKMVFLSCQMLYSHSLGQPK